jgi:hypothetical protein
MACQQRLAIMDIEERKYYSCLNLEPTLAKIWCCDEDSCFQACNCFDCKVESPMGIQCCACMEATCCLQCAAQANRWSIQRLGQYETRPCEDCIVWTAYCCERFWSTVKLIYKGYICCAYCNPLGMLCYLIFGGLVICEPADNIATCIYCSILACWQTQNCSAIKEMQAAKAEQNARWGTIQANNVKYVFQGEVVNNAGEAAPVQGQMN